MSESSPNPEYSQSKINQRSSGQSQGGQQAAVGNNNRQFQDNSTTNHFHRHEYVYPNLLDEDLEPLTSRGKVLNYLGVFVFLVLTLVFWLFFGLFVSFPFPFHQIVELIGSCFKGKLASKTNNLQKQLQLESISNRPVEKLNEIDFQARLYLRILEKLGGDKAGSHERIAKTIEVLKRKRFALRNEIEPHQPRKYKVVSKAQDFLESFALDQAEKDFEKIETVLAEVAWSERKTKPSSKATQNIIAELSEKVAQEANEISPKRLGLLYRVENLLNEMLYNETSHLQENSLNRPDREFIKRLKEERDVITERYDRLFDERNSMGQSLRDNSKELIRLNSLARKYKHEISEMQIDLYNYINENKNHKISSSALRRKLEGAIKEIGELRKQRDSLSRQTISLKRTLHQKQIGISQLESQLDKYSSMKILTGDYIGDLSRPSSK